METEWIPAPLLDVPVVAFVDWLSKVSLDTLAGERAANLYDTAHTHPLAMWLSSRLGVLCGVRLDRANQLVVELQYQNGQRALHTLPPWAARFYAHTCYVTTRLTSGVCLGLLKEVVRVAA